MDTMIPKMDVHSIKPKRVAITDTQLMAKTFPDLEWIIPELLPAGYTILAGLPKLGKSVIGLQIAEAVSSGGMLFGRKIEQGRVLYVTVEDTDRRIASRLKANLHTGTGYLDFHIGWDWLDKGGFSDLKAALRAKEYRVCILDTLFRLMSPKVRQNDSSDMAAMGDQLQKLTMGTDSEPRHVAAMIVLDHHNKQAAFEEAQDGIANISGSISKAGACDTSWSTYRKRGQRDMKVIISGRDVDEQVLEITFDPLTKCYQLKSNVAVLSMQNDILKVMMPNVGVTTTDIATALHKQPSNVSREIGELVSKGKVIVGGKRNRDVLYIKVQDWSDPLGFLDVKK